MNSTESVAKNKDELEREIDAGKEHIVVTDQKLNDELRRVVPQRSPNVDVTRMVLDAVVTLGLGAIALDVLRKAIDKGYKVKLKKSDFSLELDPGKK
ncbi:MAG: hypothetical protein J6K96_04010 [Treponema sp.]|nr:hypothetical protein [Treponema sp.]